MISLSTVRWIEQNLVLRVPYVTGSATLKIASPLADSCQCQLVGLARSSYYYQAAEKSPENLLYMRLLEQQCTRRPFYGSPRLTLWLRQQGYRVNHKRVKGYQTVAEAVDSLGRYFRFYDTERPHQALNYQTPYRVHYSR